MVKYKDYYQVLGVDRKASDADIKSAYRKAARLYHPDRNPDPGAADRFRSIQAAYDLLADDAKRRDYDLQRQRNLIDDPLQEASSLWASYIEKVIS